MILDYLQAMQFLTLVHSFILWLTCNQFVISWILVELFEMLLTNLKIGI